MGFYFKVIMLPRPSNRNAFLLCGRNRLHDGYLFTLYYRYKGGNLILLYKLLFQSNGTLSSLHVFILNNVHKNNNIKQKYAKQNIYFVNLIKRKYKHVREHYYIFIFVTSANSTVVQIECVLHYFDTACRVTKWLIK